MPGPLPGGVQLRVDRPEVIGQTEVYRVSINGKPAFEVRVAVDSRKVSVVPPGSPPLELEIRAPRGEEVVSRWVFRHWSELLVALYV